MINNINRQTSETRYFKIEKSYEKKLTCALGSRYIGTRLVSEQQSTIVGAGVDVADGYRASSVTAVIGEGHGSSKRTRHRCSLLPEHRIEQGISRDV